MASPDPVGTGFFDPQVNGYGGVDFQDDHPSVESLCRAARAWRRDGGARFLLTLITDEWSRLIHRLRTLRALRESSPELRDTICGWHIEGPFLSEKPGFCGAHEPALMLDPKPSHLRELRDVLGDDLVLLTLAPERHGALKAIEAAKELKIHVSLGHSDASMSQLSDAVAAGASAFTHLANGCPQQLDRHDNILWRAFEVPGLIVGIIPDGIHVSAPLFRLMHRVLPADRIYYTTDAMAAAGSGPGEYQIGRLRVRVGGDGIVRQPGASNFAGSSLQPGDLAKRAAVMLGADAGAILPTTLSTASRWLERS